MRAGLSIVGILLGLVLMALGFLILYFVVRAAVKSGVLTALDDSRSTVGVHRIISQLRGGGQQPQVTQQPQQQYAQPPQQYPQQGPPT